MKRYETFEDWYGEAEGWGFCCERALEDICMTPLEIYAVDSKVFRKWLLAAWEAGREEK